MHPSASALPSTSDAAPSVPALLRPRPVISTTAERVTDARANREPVHLTSILLGDWWGCARLVSQKDEDWQCWEVGDASPPSVWRVPWMNRLRFVAAGPDWVCAFSRTPAEFRCWARPRPDASLAQELPRDRGAPQPDSALGPNEALLAPPRTFVGGTFGCVLHATGAVGCVEDTPGRPGVATQSAEGGASPWSGIVARAFSAGTWHACAVDDAGSVVCRGRDGGQQLGPPASARATDVYAGDLFTCAIDAHGEVACSGATRDALFGRPGSCPEALRKAWPTLAGPVPAPRAACSSTPVRMGGLRGARDLRVGSRGLCFRDHGRIRCAGAIPTPRIAERPSEVIVSPGADASACAIVGERVLCWGEAYALAGALDVPVAIALLPPRAPRAAILAFGNADWDYACLARRGCSSSPAEIPPCAAGTESNEWSALAPSTIAGSVVTVRGALTVALGASVGTGCFPRPGSTATPCCSFEMRHVVLSDWRGLLGPILADFSCTGDDSMVCCDAPAYGETVVVTGRLVPTTEEGTNLHAPWSLADVALCQESDGGAPP